MAVDDPTTMRVTALEAGLAVLLIVAFTTGGGSQARDLGDTLSQLLAVPVLAMALLALPRRPADGLRLAAVIVALLIAAVPALQLLPIPHALWEASPARAALKQDLLAAGAGLPRTWTLTPAATEQALWSLLPAMAAFFAALSLAGRQHRRLAWLIVMLVIVSLVLGVAQRALGQGSALDLFPQWVPAFGGVFANPNHQASALVIGGVLALGLWLDGRKPARDRPVRHWQQWLLMACLALCMAALPLTDSRAGLLMAAPALMALLLMASFSGRRGIAPCGLSRFRITAAVAVIALCGSVAMYWFMSTVRTEARWPMARATADLARDLWPLGSGVGSFVPWFEQSGPDALLLAEYINHAHNEYVQWWMEGGLLALLVLAAVLVVLALVLRALIRKRTKPLAFAAWIGIAVLLAASLVDYPLRTPALMTIAAWLAGVAVAHASRRLADRHTARMAAALAKSA